MVLAESHLGGRSPLVSVRLGGEVTIDTGGEQFGEGAHDCHTAVVGGVSFGTLLVHCCDCRGQPGSGNSSGRVVVEDGRYGCIAGWRQVFQQLRGNC